MQTLTSTLPPTDPIEIDQDDTLHWMERVQRSPWVWGVFLTVGFYLAIPHLTIWQAEAYRYFCSHWVEYLEVGLFFVGMVVLTQKAWGLRREFVALRHAARPLPTSNVSGARDELHTVLSTLSLDQSRTVWGQRLRGIVRFLKERTSTTGLQDHLKYLTEGAADRLFDSHSLLQTIIWAIPIMGFLGTVMGITLAIANVTPEQLDTSLPEVTGGLAVAFDTTAIALVFSLVLVFGSLFVKRSEDGVLSIAEEQSLRMLGPLLDYQNPSGQAILEAENESARRLLESTGQLIEQQAGLWQGALDTLRQRWSETITSHEDTLTATLQAGAKQTLTAHAEQLDVIRQEFLTACQILSQHVSQTIQKVETDRQTHDAVRQAELERWTTLLREDMLNVSRAQRWQLRDTLDEFATRMERWQSSFGHLAIASEQQAAVLSAHTQALLQIVGQEEHLATLQLRLNQNLESLRATEHFEESIHSLNAAIHLLTARAHTRAA